MAATKGNLADGELRGSLTVLRPVRQPDLARIADWDQDPEIVALMGRKFVAGAENAQQWYQRTKADRRCRVWAIETLADRELIGEIELDRIDWRAGTAELRICIGEKAFWGHGYGRDALGCLLAQAFSYWHLKAIYLRVYQANMRAIRLYERLGFTPQGIMEPIRRRGDASAILLMSLTRTRHQRIQPEYTVAAASPR